MSRQSFSLTEAQDVFETRTGRRPAIHTLRKWGRLHPAIKTYCGGRIGFRVEAVAMIASGVRLGEVDRRLAALDAANAGEVA